MGKSKSCPPDTFIRRSEIFSLTALFFSRNFRIGSPEAVADASGNVVKRIDYDSFGNIISDSDPLFAVPFGFAGGLHDRDTGLVLFGYRDYDPYTGRWTAKDPILFAGGDTDLYGYCLSDPINSVDPGGLLNLWGGIVGGIIGGVGGVLGSLASDNISISGVRDAFIGGVAGGFVGGMFDVKAGIGAGIGAAVAAGYEAAKGANIGAIIGAGIGGGIGGALTGYVGGSNGVAIGTWIGASRAWAFGLLGGKLYEHFFEKPSANPCN